MSQGISEWFLTTDDSGFTRHMSTSGDAKYTARFAVAEGASNWVKVYHLDFTTNKMTLIKEYRRRTESDEEGIVEYV